MKPVFTSAQMRLSEQNLFDTGVSSYALMETAAQRLCEAALKMLPENGTCVFACGTGGNGGDGYAAARLLNDMGVRVIAIKCGEPKQPDAIKNYELAREKIFACVDMDKLDSLPKPALWVDCIFGIGLSRAPEGDALKLIRRMNADALLGSKILSCDIPSGLNADNGCVYGECVTADKTLSFQAHKRGHILGEGLNYCGCLEIADIGIGENCYPKDYMRLIEDADVKQVLPKRKRTAHKNDFGHLLIISGSHGMAGAAAICAMAALRSGAGLVTVACPESICDILQTLAPCAMCLPLAEKDGAISNEALETLKRAYVGKTAIAIGPGLSRKCDKSIIASALESGIKAVIDADALNIISENAELKALLKPHHAITPHPGEAARLLGSNVRDCASCVQMLSDLGCMALLKGATSLITGEYLCASMSGSVGMAKGGSGDALTGIVGALMAQGMDSFQALWAGSHIHGTAGELAAEKHGIISMTAFELIDCIGEAFAKCLR